MAGSVNVISAARTVQPTAQRNVVEIQNFGVNLTPPDGNKGDITTSGGGASLIINPNVVTNAKLVDVTTATFKGRVTAGSGSPEDLTATQATSLLNPATGLLKGLMASSDFSKLAGIAPLATANSSDAFLINRANHTGTQVAATISDFVAATLASVATGLSLATSTVVSAADSILVALGKLQAQVSLRLIASQNLADLTNASTARANLGLGTLSTQTGTFSGTSSGTNTGDQTITLTSDVTGSGSGNIVATIAPNAVTNAKAAQMTAVTFKANVSAITDNPTDATQDQMQVALNMSGLIAARNLIMA